MNVMSKAWDIAREGAKKFGGKTVEYFAEALRMAWTIIKKEAVKVKEVAKFAMLETLSGSRNHKTWVAKITGKHAKFNFNREFIEAWDEYPGGKEFKLYNENVYEVCDGGNRFFAKVENGEIEKISAGQVAEMFA